MSGCSSRGQNRKLFKTGGDLASAASDSSGTGTPEVEGSSDSAFVERNPLQNRVILHHLFELCPTDVLATCRLVCKQWQDESLLIWRNTSTLRFRLKSRHIYMEYEEPCPINDGARHPIRLPLATFLEYAADAKNQFNGKPYRQIRLQKSTIDSNIKKRKQFDIFWNALGSNLTTLELKDCRFHDHKEFRRIIFTHCPKLERLIIDGCKFSKGRNSSVEELDPLYDVEQTLEQNTHLKVLEIVIRNKKHRTFPVSWLELLSHFPLMSSLSIRAYCDVHEDEEFLDSLLKAIKMVRKRDGNLLPFTYFDVGTFHVSANPVNKERLTIFQELHLPVRRLFVFANPDVDDEFCRDTVAFCSKTVKHLNVAGPSLSEFPYGYQLNNVIYLCIEEGFLNHLALLKYVPNLEELDIFEMDGRKTQKITISTLLMDPELTHLKMEKLKHLELHCKLQNEDFAKIHNWMPNVTDLTVDVNDEQFRIVCKTWRNLKRLGVFGSKLTDKGVTGRKNKMDPDITDLENLEEFVFGSYKLTNKSVFRGFLQLAHLRIIRQFGKKPVRWGKRARRAILDRNIELQGCLRDA